MNRRERYGQASAFGGCVPLEGSGVWFERKRSTGLSTSRMSIVCGLLVLGFAATPAVVSAQQQTSIRIMAANVTSGNRQSYLEPGSRILDAFDPDIVLIQEFLIGTEADTSDPSTGAFVRDALGPEYSWCREPGGDALPNGIISRWPIKSCGQWPDDQVSNRDFSWARIDLPGDTDLWAVSLHLLTTDSKRPAEARRLVELITSNVLADAFLVVGGDLNTDS